MVCIGTFICISSCTRDFFFFFFQAEDGIRDHCVTGVQTCALPISNDGGADVVRVTNRWQDTRPGGPRRLAQRQFFEPRLDVVWRTVMTEPAPPTKTSTASLRRSWPDCQRGRSSSTGPSPLMARRPTTGSPMSGGGPGRHDSAAVLCHDVRRAIAGAAMRSTPAL